MQADRQKKRVERYYQYKQMLLDEFVKEKETELDEMEKNRKEEEEEE